MDKTISYLQGREPLLFWGCTQAKAKDVKRYFYNGKMVTKREILISPKIDFTSKISTIDKVGHYYKNNRSIN